MGMNSITYEKSANAPDVAFMTVDPQNSGTSGSDITIVGNVHFLWESATGGFTNSGFWGGGYGPMTQWTTDAEVTAYLSNPGANLNQAFSAWQAKIDGMPIGDQFAEVGAFCAHLSTLGVPDGCMTGDM